ncbi:serine/arginine-rich splicing factor RSZ21A-like isoform X1 [Tribolium madens]|uniref:serine/arginine-rich splicing factor RSZ21A-like isoform X1 n=1 Tax=Tribolium madens TaxID=41895 RepID=UPI001CF7344E|nr:serine/arginine-rich splicing factor RSZ21A-like isoform X1 [Tribolium madens]XP_044254462.1 serine/arginine-rich splicing factor RSZ21A-like isoform X1 [Tribolium madens]XP_044254463.1 serine/arginine-rich splicing factor RSZ21A-like isoform X1 [Tribolium madens]XP_044254464.1 serine/arginine-rich splicing factor RSZ21A-like isoform X1 [Tribolium madens]XP_044254465.1 serine/arginine-rich splicing factor RSZ21A-like isoform X1 [Tribolium madens]
MRDNDQEKSQSPEQAEKRRSRSTSNSSKNSNKSKQSRSSYSKSRSRSRSRSSEADGYRLHIADIGDDVRKSDLEKVFAPFGDLKEVWMTNSTPCFGFAVFKDKKAANAALKATDGIEVAGSRIRVTHARPRTRGSGRRFFNSNMRCYQCGYSGHFYRDCPELNGGGGDKRDRNSRYDSHYDRSRRHRDRDRDYYERDYGRRHQRSSRRYDDYRRSSRRHRY